MHGFPPRFPGEVIVVDGFTVGPVAWLLLVDNPFHAVNILLFSWDGERRFASNTRTRSRISNPQPTKSMSCMASVFFGSPRGLVSSIKVEVKKKHISFG